MEIGDFIKSNAVKLDEVTRGEGMFRGVSLQGVTEEQAGVFATVDTITSEQEFKVVDPELGKIGIRRIVQAGKQGMATEWYVHWEQRPDTIFTFNTETMKGVHENPSAETIRLFLCKLFEIKTI